MPGSLIKKTCIQCCLCVAACPEKIIRRDGQGAIIFDPEREDLCIKCGHCMAVCPTKAVNTEGLLYGRDLFDIIDDPPAPNFFFSLLKSRRSVRVFKSKPVPRRILQKIVDAISMAPMGFPPHKLELTIIERREVIEMALPLIVSMYEDMAGWMGNPVTRFFIRRGVKPEVFNMLKKYIVPWVKRSLPLMKDGKADLITRGAPVLFIFHAKKSSENHTEDALIALGHGLLSAHALGLGATAIGLIPPAVERNRQLRAIFNIPDGNEVVASMIAGYPRHEYKRGIRRELAAVSWI